MILSLLLAGGLSFGLLWCLLRSGRVDIARDRANECSLHVGPTPRVRGPDIMAATVRVLAVLRWKLARPAAVLFPPPGAGQTR
jgi:hypothetical protein